MTASIGDIIRVTAVMRVGNSGAVMNVFDLRCTLAATVDDGDLMEAFADWLNDAYNEAYVEFSTALEFVEVRGFNVTQDRPMPTVPWPTLTTGGGSGEYTPLGVAALVLFRTFKARVVGRKFWGVLPEAVWASGELIGTAITHFVSMAVVLLSGPSMGVGGGAFTYTIVDKLGIARDPVSIVVRAVAAYQRRRRPGRGV